VAASSAGGEQFEDHRSALTALYTKRDPAKLGTIDEMLDKYGGSERNLWKKLQSKYGEDAIPPANFSMEEEEEEEVGPEDAAPAAVGCFGTRESPKERQQRMQAEAEAAKADNIIVRCCNAVFGGPPAKGEVPMQYPWLIVSYAGTHFWCLCCAYILLLYGVMFEESVGHAWLVYALVSICLDLFVKEPAYLFSIAVIMSCWQMYNRKNIRDMGMN